jgi:hypothetical protein
MRTALRLDPALESGFKLGALLRIRGRIQVAGVAANFQQKQLIF